jgi:exodeoxyribonuclease VII large subunit
MQTLIKGLRYSLKFIKNEGQRLRSGEGNIKLLDPRSVLKRGYSITYNNGKAVRAASDVKAGDSLRTALYKGEVISKVEGKKSMKGRGNS